MVNHTLPDGTLHEKDLPLFTGKKGGYYLDVWPEDSPA
jgi:hypothetical protein